SIAFRESNPACRPFGWERACRRPEPGCSGRRTVSVTNSPISKSANTHSVDDDAADGFAAHHEVEAFVDLLERHGVGDQVVDVDLAVHVPVDDLRHIGPPARATE